MVDINVDEMDDYGVLPGKDECNAMTNAAQSLLGLAQNASMS